MKNATFNVKQALGYSDRNWQSQCLLDVDVMLCFDIRDVWKPQGGWHNLNALAV